MAQIYRIFCLACVMLAITAVATVSAADAVANNGVLPSDPMSALTPTPAMKAMMGRMRTMMMMSPVVDAVCEIDERMQANTHGGDGKPPSRPGECWMCLRACRMDSQCFSQCRKQINSDDDDGSQKPTHDDMMQPFMKNQECQDLNKCYNMTCSKQMIQSMNDASNMAAMSNSSDSTSTSTPMQMPMAKMRAMLNQQLKCVQTSCADMIKPCLNSNGVQDACVVRGCTTSCRADCRAKCSAQCA